MTPTNNCGLNHESTPHIDGHFCKLMSNRHEGRDLIAFGCASELIIDLADSASLEKLQQWLDGDQSWVFGCLGYDLKNSVERLNSGNSNYLQLPDLAFFRPKHVFQRDHGEWTQVWGKPISLREELTILGADPDQIQSAADISLKPLLSKEEYLQAMRRIHHHLQVGDIYEINFCQGFVGEARDFDALSAFSKLNGHTRAPYAAYFQIGDAHLMCGSPERFLQKRGSRLISQPIKGTRARGKNKEEDERLRLDLAHSQKDRSENVMITDLVRNDLSRVARPGSVQVDELFGIHSFETVHQMISTVSCEVSSDISFTDILRATFPMGSMTGAPKVRSMQLIEELENFRRGWYSGSVGYIEPNGNFDFNVIIRSLMYNSSTGMLGAFAGGAIVAESVDEEEYDESLLKLDAIFKSLKS